LEFTYSILFFIRWWVWMVGHWTQ